MITNLQQLWQKGRLKYGDILMFGDLKYEVSENGFVYLQEGKSSAEIFRILNIENKEEFCDKIYGYRNWGSYFPGYASEDYKAAYRIAEALYMKLEGEEYKEGDLVYVKNGECCEWVRGIYLCTLPGNALRKYVCIDYGDEEKYRKGEKFFTSNWYQMKSYKEEKLELTIDEIAEKFGVEPENIKIKK